METIAQKLRRQPSLSERRMWQVLQPFRSSGYHFRKQAAIGPYVADFVCHHAMVVVEVDGDQHGFSQANDATRDEYMRERGYRVLRIPSIELMDNKDGVYALVEQLLRQTPPRPRGSIPTSPLAGEVAQPGAQRPGAARWGEQPGEMVPHLTPSPAPLGPVGPSFATLPARGRVKGKPHA